MIEGIFEIGMLLCFASAWPFNIVRCYKARTIKGMSLPFLLIIELAYVLGMINKIVIGEVNHVFAFYVLDFVLVLIQVFIYFRNRHIDSLAIRE